MIRLSEREKEAAAKYYINSFSARLSVFSRLPTSSKTRTPASTGLPKPEDGWAKTKAEAEEWMMRSYRKSNVDDRYLEEASVSLQAVELVGEPNPANIKAMAEGRPYEFKRDKPGILTDKWGY
jgi:hypothetical protein